MLFNNISIVKNRKEKEMSIKKIISALIVTAVCFSSVISEKNGSLIVSDGLNSIFHVSYAGGRTEYGASKKHLRSTPYTILRQKIKTNMEVPNCDTSFKAYMDYRSITDTTTDQYRLQQCAATDGLGLRRYGDYYLAAMGTYYSDSVGDTFRITLDNGNSFNIMIGDIKQDIHTDSKNMYTPVYDRSGSFYSANVIEFIVDTDSLSRYVRLLGTVSGYDYFDGSIKKVEKTGKISIK